MHEALKRHIFEVVGGAFHSHDSGRGTIKRLFTQESDESEDSLMHYLQNHLGMLTFFQLNTILEGLYNSNLDFRVFFKSDRQVAREYAVGDFVRQITATFRLHSPPPDSTLHVEASEQASSIHGTRDSQLNLSVSDFFGILLENSERPSLLDEDVAHRFRRLCTTPTVRGHVLDQFLTVTEVICLKPMKKRIERCRRGLLDDLIEVTHRRDPLIQAEPPDELRDRIEDVNETQLRGYVMLFAAKMPLVSNVLLHLEDLHYARTRKGRQKDDKGQADDDVENVSSEAYVPFQSWKQLLKALENDVEGLSEAIDQAQADRMLYEEEQIHAQQETLAEIQRLRERGDDALSPAHNVAVNIIANLLAFAAVIVAVVTLAGNNILSIHLSFADFLGMFSPANWAADFEAIKIVLFVVGAYLVALFCVQLLARVAIRLFRRELRLDARYYYELDIHIDAPFHVDVLDALFETGVPEKSRLKRASFLWRLLFPLVAIWSWVTQLRHPPEFKHALRNSYRTERMEKSEGLHKIYVEADIRVGMRRFPPSVGRFIHAILVYELLYHRPAQEHGYVFKDLRVVCTHARSLSKSEIVILKRTIARCFVDPCLQPGWRLDAQNDSLFTVTEPPYS
jgi:hypothetical protein